MTNFDDDVVVLLITGSDVTNIVVSTVFWLFDVMVLTSVVISIGMLSLNRQNDVLLIAEEFTVSFEKSTATSIRTAFSSVKLVMMDSDRKKLIVRFEYVMFVWLEWTSKLTTDWFLITLWIVMNDVKFGRFTGRSTTIKRKRTVNQNETAKMLTL